MAIILPNMKRVSRENFIFGEKIISGAGGGKSGKAADEVRTPREAPNTLQSVNTVRVVDVLSEGEIVGLGNGAKSIFYDETPLQNDDDSFNFTGVSYSERYGEPVQNYVPGFAQTENEITVDTPVTEGSPVTRQITDADINAVRVRIQLPSGLSRTNTENGDINGTTVELALDVQENGGGFIEVKTISITGKTTSPYDRSYRIELNAGGEPWDVRVRRVTPDSGSSALIDNTSWSSYTEIIDAKLYYPDTALIAASVNAEEFGGQIPRRAYEILGLKLQIPSNYDPITRIYTGIWDGSFVTDWTDNPAWVLYDILTSKRYGVGYYLDADRVDKWELYNIAQFCDELVDDGFGGTEPRYRFNGVINAREDTYATLNAIASNFHGLIYWGSDVVAFSQDRPSDAVKLVTPANVVGGELNYTGTSLAERHSVALVTWNDPDDGYNNAVEVVEDSELIDDLGWKPLEIVAFGCTSRGQAYRYGKWLLVTEKYETERLSYRASFDHADVRPGDTIAVADPAYAGVRFGGRIAAATVGQITVDSEVTLEVAETYEISVILADGTVETRGVTNTPGTYTVLTLATNLSDVPLTGSMWIVTASNVEPRLFKIVTVSESERHIFDITATFHDPDKFTRIETDIVLEDNSYSVFPVGVLPVVSNIQAAEYTYRSGGAILSAARISWEPPTDPREVGRIALYELQMRKPDQTEFEIVATPPEPSADVRDLVSGVYGFRVRVLDALGSAGAWVPANIDLLGAAAPPADVDNFGIQVTGDTALLTWDPVPDIDLSHYRIRYSPEITGVTWGSALDMATDVVGNQISLPAKVGTYLIKAVDVFDSESVNAALIVSEIAGLAGFNAVEVVTEAPDYLGTHVDTFAFAGVLQLGNGEVMADWPDLTATTLPSLSDGVVSEGTYFFAANPLDLGSVFTSRLVATFSASGYDKSAMSPNEEDWDAVLQVRTTPDDPGGSPVWTDWLDFFVGDYTARAFEWRMVLKSFAPNVTPQIENLSVTVDMPDRVAGAANIVCPIAGLQVNYAPAFNARPALAVDVQDLDTGDYKTITGQDSEGFFVQCFDALDTPVERIFDYVAVGYGSKQA